MRAVVNNRVEEVIEVRPYEYDADKLEIFFMFNGITKVGAIIEKEALIVDEPTTDAELVITLDDKTEELEAAIIEEFGVVASVDYFGDCNHITVEGYNHLIHICLDEEEYSCSTLHLTNHKRYSLDEDKYKNTTIRKTLKGVINYINRYM